MFRILEKQDHFKHVTSSAFHQVFASCSVLLLFCHYTKYIDIFTLPRSVSLAEINGLDEDFYGNVTPSEIISSLGTLWNFGPGQQDAHELFHVILNALESEMQPANRVRRC